MITLYDYYRSSASYRVRIALAYKGIEHQLESVHLVNDGGEQYYDDYVTMNPQARVPTWVEGDFALSQSMAILEYMEERFPSPSLLPSDAKGRAYVRSLAQLIASDVHPLNNLSVLNYLEESLTVSEADKYTWYAHWIQLGFHAFEKKIAQSAGKYCVGNQITMADVCLIPQVYNAKRFKVDYSNCPTIERIYQMAMQQDCFKITGPDYVSAKACAEA